MFAPKIVRFGECLT